MSSETNTSQIIGFEQSDQTNFTIEHWYNYALFKEIEWRTEIWVWEYMLGYGIIADLETRKNERRL